MARERATNVQPRPRSETPQRLPRLLRLKYRMYEQAVQDAESTVGLLGRFARDLTDFAPKRLREDFSGTFRVSAAWIGSEKDRTAMALDLDPEPLLLGLERETKKRPGDKSRLTVLQENVMSPTKPLADIACAGNFSFYALRTRSELLSYFRASRDSLVPGGLLALQMGGGPGFTRTPLLSQRLVRYGRGAKANEPWFKYIWQQRSYNPITHCGRYTISFALCDGRRMVNAFTYDWRVWTIAEVCECLSDAGFERSVVYWEDLDCDAEGDERYRIIPAPRGYDSWVCYVVAVR